LLASFGRASTLAAHSPDVVGYAVVAAASAVWRLNPAEGGGAPMCMMQLAINLAIGLDSHNDTLRQNGTDAEQVGIRKGAIKTCRLSRQHVVIDPLSD
jgi:hypothetical protein